MVMSATLPGVRANATGRPRSSAKQWTLLVKPPRERPIAWLQDPLYGWPAPHRAALLGLQGSGDEERSETMPIAVLGIDLGKNSCGLVGLDVSGRVVLRRRMRRESVITFGAQLPPCVVAMEACCGGRRFRRSNSRCRPSGWRNAGLDGR